MMRRFCLFSAESVFFILFGVMPLFGANPEDDYRAVESAYRLSRQIIVNEALTLGPATRNSQGDSQINEMKAYLYSITSLDTLVRARSIVDITRDAAMSWLRSQADHDGYGQYTYFYATRMPLSSREQIEWLCKAADPQDSSVMWQCMAHAEMAKIFAQDKETTQAIVNLVKSIMCAGEFEEINGRNAVSLFLSRTVSGTAFVILRETGFETPGAAQLLSYLSADQLKYLQTSSVWFDLMKSDQIEAQSPDDYMKTFSTDINLENADGLTREARQLFRQLGGCESPREN